MKILILTGIFPPDIGGPATYVPHLAAGLARRGHRITVLTVADRVGNHADQYPFRVVRLPRRMFKPWRWLYTVVKASQIARDADVLFVNGLAMEAVVANLLLRKPMIQKVVGDAAWERAVNRAWVRDDFEHFQRRRYGLKVEMLKALRAWWTRQADGVIVPSRYLAGWVQRWGVPDSKITVICNAVQPPDGIAPADVPLPTLVKVATAGRLVSWKHVDMLLEAVARLEGVGLVVIGDGPERGRLEMLGAALGIADRVHFAGARSRTETLALMAACDVFVLNSTYEGLPHVVIEAMSIGLPVVATSVGGTPEVVQDRINGRLVAPLDNEALYEVLCELITSASQRQRLGKEGKCTAERFSLRQMVEQSALLIENVSRIHSV